MAFGGYNELYYLKEEKTNFNLPKIIYNFFFLFVLFPYVSFGLPTFSDAQPWALIFAIPICLLNLSTKKQISKILWMFCFLSLLSIIQYSLFFIFEGGTLIAYLRSVYKYFSFAIILLASLFSLKFLNLKIFGFAVILWFLVANIQLITKNLFFVDYILSNVRYRIERGSYVVGFASEPAYLGRMGVVFLIINDFLGLKNNHSKFFRFILFIMSIELIVISFSITGYILGITYLFFKFSFSIIYKKRKWLKILFTIFLITFAGIIINHLSSYDFLYRLGRVGRFILKGIQYGFLNALTEESSFRISFSELMQPFVNFRFFGNGIPEERTASMASIFSMVYDVGIYGILLIGMIIFIFFYGILKTKDLNEKYFLINLFIVYFLMVLVDTVSLSYLPFLLAFPLFFYKKS